MTSIAYPSTRLDAPGWCAACRRAGQLVPAVDAGLPACREHLRLLPRRPAGPDQLALDLAIPTVPPELRTPYPTGEQTWCADCVARHAVRPRLGLSERTPGDPTPLCFTCWRSRSDQGRRSRRGLTPEQAGWIADLQARLACEVCGRPDGLGDCWRCGDQVVFLAQARAVHQRDQAHLQRERERVDELTHEHAVALDRIGRTRRRHEQLVGWRQRLLQVVEALPQLSKTGPRGQLRVSRSGSSRARPWWLLADYLARDPADRTARGLSLRGRPSQLPLVVAVMAVMADYRSGRGSMAGLAWTATFAGVAERTVTNGWARTVTLGCTRRVRRGRILTVAERAEHGRHRQRAVYDFAQLHVSPIDARPYLPAARDVLAQLLAHATALVDEHQAVLDEATAAAAAVEAELLDAQAWLAEQHRDDLTLQAAVDPSWSGQAQRAAKAALQSRARATRAAAPPVDPLARTAAHRARREEQMAARQAVDNAIDQANRWTNFCDHPRRGLGKRSSSGLYWGLQFSAQSTSPLAQGQRPNGRGEEHQGGASRPAPTMNCHSSPSRPRTLKAVRLSSQRQRGRSAAMHWAKSLAGQLADQWEFLQRFLADADDGQRSPLAVARERGLRLRMIAATLGSRLGPEWTTGDVVLLVERYAVRFTVIAAGDAHSPLRYLAAMLDRALTAPHAVVPHHSPVREAYEREVIAADQDAALSRSAALRLQFDQRDAAAAVARTGDQAGLRAARAAAAAAAAHGLAARAAAARDEHESTEWPVPVAPGSGIGPGPGR